MTPTLPPSRSRQLFEIADPQAGYFTAAQALALGYSYPQQHHHVQQGTWQRVGHGLFRLTAYPLTPHEQLARLTLWSRDNTGAAQAVVSHDTALALHALSDLLPERLHLTVPPGFRKPAPIGVVLHRGQVAPGERRTEHGFQVTTVVRTLRDVATDGLEVDLLTQAVDTALQRGEISRAQAATVRELARRAQ